MTARPLTIFCMTLFAALISLSAPAQAELFCRSEKVTAKTIVYPTETIAYSAAVTKWTARTTARHGASFANIKNAIEVRHSCRIKTNLIGANGWTCTLTARPCRID